MWTFDLPAEDSADEVMKHGAMKMILDEGFPTYKNPFTKGRLLVVFSVEFPESLTADAVKKISSALPRPPKPTASADAEDVQLLEFDGKGKYGGEEEENGDEDDDQPNGP